MYESPLPGGSKMIELIPDSTVINAIDIEFKKLSAGVYGGECWQPRRRGEQRAFRRQTRLPDDIIEQIWGFLGLRLYTKYSCKLLGRLNTNPHTPPVDTPWFFTGYDEKDFRHMDKKVCHLMRFERGFEVTHRKLAGKKSGAGAGAGAGAVCVGSIIPGWLYYKRGQNSFRVANPLTGSHVDFTLNFPQDVYYEPLAMSPPPDCAVLMYEWHSNGRKNMLHLFRQHHNPCLPNNLPELEAPNHYRVPEARALFWREKFYVYHPLSGLIEIDPKTAIPTAHRIAMDDGLPPYLMKGFETIYQGHQLTFHLVECNGSLLLIEMDCDIRPPEFKLYEADVIAKRWLPLENIGDWILLIHGRTIFSMLGAALGIKGNSICRLESNNSGHTSDMGVFDLSTKEMIHVVIPHNLLDYSYILFLPRLVRELRAVAVITGKEGAPGANGNIYFTQRDGPATVTGSISGLSPGLHELVIPALLNTAVGYRTTTGDDFNPDNEICHACNLGNVIAGEDGTAEFTFTNSQISLHQSGTMSIIGSAIEVHVIADDPGMGEHPHGTLTGHVGTRAAGGTIQEGANQGDRA